MFKYFLSFLLFIFQKALLPAYKITIITSVFNADQFIEFYLKNISYQTIYKDCEHIIINANSSGNESTIIQKFASDHANVKYIELSFDPGLYGVWNIGVLLSNSEYLINSNVDDHLKHDALETLSGHLDAHPEIDLVYSDFYLTKKPNISFENSTLERLIKKPDFSIKNLQSGCCPGAFPMWRKSFHERFGLFDQSYKIKGDYEMWLRAAFHGAVFFHLPFPLGVMYENLSGLSYNRSYELTRKIEGKLLLKKYSARG